MGRMSLNDPSYAILYFQACRLNPLVADIMVKPVDRARNTNFRNDFPSAKPGFIPQGKPGANAFRAFPQDRPCFGCGGIGHSMGQCPEMLQLLTEGTVIKDAAGKYALANGAMIRRQTPDETLAAAAKRLKAVQANYVSVHQIMTSTRHVEESESEFEEVNQVAT